MNYDEYDMYDDTYEDEAIIECALDIYDEYDVSMEEAIDIAMEKVYRSIGGHKAKKLKEKIPSIKFSSSDSYWHAYRQDKAFWDALRNAKTGGNNDPEVREYFDSERNEHGDFGWKQGKNALRKFKFKDTVIDRGNPTPKPAPIPAPTPTRSEPTPTPIKNPIPKPEPAPIPAPTPTPTPTTPIKKRIINPKTGIAVGAGAAALGAGGVALYKYRKKKLAEAAKAQKEAEELDSRAARKRAKAEDAVAQAKEASIYFDYD